MKPTEVQAALRREGWGKAGGDTVVWQHAEHGEVTVAHPNVARGLEFDAVIVVEPADFPQNLGRHGLLYTALTRANRELVVLHTKPLPDKLRKR
ncbi:MAG TPA: ATP-binding domain-containing protein [Micromonospora sp.]